MPRKCKVCEHPQKTIIESWFRNQVVLSEISKGFNVSESSLYRHFKNHYRVEDPREKPQGVFRKIIWPAPIRKRG